MRKNIIIKIFTAVIAVASTGFAATGSQNAVWNEGKMTISWNAAGNGTYSVARAGSRLGTYTDLGTVTATSFTDNSPNANKYENYYRITPQGGGEAQLISLENVIFGDNVLFYDRKYDAQGVSVNEINRIHDDGLNGRARTYGAEFGTMRWALMLKEGDYRAGNTEFKVGFYTGIYGVAASPDLVRVPSIQTRPHLWNDQSADRGNATCTFWRSVENVQFNRAENLPNRWAVSQAAPMRRCDIVGDCWMDWNGGWCSGGYVADSRFSANAGSGSGQQWYNRNDHFPNGFTGIGMNSVKQGSTGNNAAGGENVVIETSPIIREKPFVYLEGGEYKVFVPALRRDARGLSWSNGQTGAGRSIDISDFYVAQADRSTAAQMNLALASGKHLLLTPGMYYLDAPIHVKNPNTVVLGIGYATVIPNQNNQYGAIFVEDVAGVTVSGVMFDAHYSSEYLIRIGDFGADKNHAENPTVIHDVICRIGGFRNDNVNVKVACQINSNNVIMDHSWLWRADHGAGVGWTRNTSDYGLIVTGDDVVCYGTFSEHFQKNSLLWMGERGRNYFYQNETPYDPASQNAWKSHGGTVDGWAQYKVADNVTNHYTVGLGIYDCLFNCPTGIYLQNGMEIPNTPNVRVESLYLNKFGGSGTGIRKGINGQFDGATSVGGARGAFNWSHNANPPASDLEFLQNDIPKNPSVPNIDIKKISIPATFNATEWFDKSGNVGRNDDANGKYAGGLQGGSFLEYCIEAAEAGRYKIAVRNAVGNNGQYGETKITVSLSGNVLGTLDASIGEDWFNWTASEIEVELPAGEMFLRLTASAAVNIEDITISKVSGGQVSLSKNKAQMRAVSAGINNRKINISLPSSAKDASVILCDIRGRVLFNKQVSLSLGTASVALPESISKNQAVILQVKTNSGVNLTKKVMVK